MMMEKSSGFTIRDSIKFGVFVVVCAYFAFALYMLIPSARFGSELISDYAHYQELMKVPWWIILFYSSELGGGVGSVLRSVAGFFALYSAVLFWRKKENALSLIRGKVSTALLLEAGYYLSLIPSVILGFVFALTGGSLWYFDTTPTLVVLLVNAVACLMMVIVIPPLLFKLRSKITQGSSSQDIVKWCCLTGISYLFVVFWFNYSIAWVANMIPYWRAQGQYGLSFLLEPINLIGFLATVLGLFLIAIFGLMFTLPAIKKLPVELSLRRIGAIMTAFGGYFVLNILLFLLTGGYAAHPNVWYEIIVPHNPDLWSVTLLFIGLPLLAGRKITRLE